MIDVILCDDHALIRRGIRDTLCDSSDIRVVGEAGDGAQLPHHCRTNGARRTNYQGSIPFRQTVHGTHQRECWLLCAATHRYQ